MHAASETEARKLANQLLRQEPFFFTASASSPLPQEYSTSNEEDSDDNTDPSYNLSSNNLFHKASHSRGLDVEKLYFRVRERSTLPVGTGYWLLFGIKAAGVWSGSPFPTVYSSFPLQFGKPG